MKENMGGFIARLFIACLIGVGCLALLFVLTSIDGGVGFFSKITKSDGIAVNSVAVNRLEISMQENAYTKLIVGDSTANGIFSSMQEYNDTYYIATTNRGSTLKGYFCILQLFQEAHPSMTDVYVIIRPQTLRAIMNTKDSYTSIILPLYKTQNIDLFNDEDREELDDLFGKTFIDGVGAEICARSALARKLYLNALYSQNEMGVETRECFSPLTLRTIQEMKKFCKEHDIKMHFISAPLLLESGEYDFSLGDDLASEFQIEDIWNQMRTSVTYYSKECFSDNYHLSREYINENREEIIERMVEKLDANDLDDLVYSINDK